MRTEVSQKGRIGALPERRPHGLAWLVSLALGLAALLGFSLIAVQPSAAQVPMGASVAQVPKGASAAQVPMGAPTGPCQSPLGSANCGGNPAGLPCRPTTNT